MFFRFVASLILVVLVSMVGIGLEKQTLEMKRAVSRQYFQVDLLLEMHARHRLRIQELTAPSQLAKLEAETSNLRDRLPIEAANAGSTAPKVDGGKTSSGATLPLLRWAHPVPSGQ